MASGLVLTSTPIEPSQVWSREEWREQQPWATMPKSPLRDFFKAEGMAYIYGGNPDKFRAKYQGSQTGRFRVNHPPMDFMPRRGDRVKVVFRDGRVTAFDVE